MLQGRLRMPGRAFVLRSAAALRWAIFLAWVLIWLTGIFGPWRMPRVNWVGYFIASLFAMLLLEAWVRWQREWQVREAPIPQFLKRKLRDQYPGLTAKDCDLVERGLRQYFLACLRSRKRFVAMPSKAVDAMWHEFILHTRAYNDWCGLCLGRFLHHTPAEAMSKNGKKNDGLRRAWYWACRDESIDPRRATRLPLLFALDAKLGIEGGFTYVPDCRDINGKSDANGTSSGSYCGESFSDGSFSGDADSFGGSDGGGSDGGGDGGGDGGDGGGCGGD